MYWLFMFQNVCSRRPPKTTIVKVSQKPVADSKTEIPKDPAE